MPDSFPYDVFLSHSAKDKAVVRPLAERLRQGGVKVWLDEWVLPKDEIRRKKEEGPTHPSSFKFHPLEKEGLERSRVLVLCMSANAFGSDWAQLESGTFRFRDPLNKERRFLSVFELARGMSTEYRIRRNECALRARSGCQSSEAGHESAGCGRVPQIQGLAAFCR